MGENSGALKKNLHSWAGEGEWFQLLWTPHAPIAWHVQWNMEGGNNKQKRPAQGPGVMDTFWLRRV